MRKLRQFGILYIVACMTSIFIGCEKETSHMDIQTSKNTSDIAIFEGMGFCSADIQDLGDYYLVEGDIRFDKEDMRNYMPTTRQYHCGWLVGVNYQDAITIRIDNSLINQSNWKDAIIAAINAWNSESGCRIQMTYTTSSTADITFSSESLYGAIAQSSFPRNNRPGPTVKVDTYYNSFTLAEKTWVMMHELGHNFGLRHTDYMNRAGDGGNEGEPIDQETGNRIYAVHIPGTPTNKSDSQSLMWSLANTTPTSYTLRSYPTYSFTEYDKIALQNVYPSNPFYFTTPEQYLLNDVTNISINTIDRQRFPIESVSWTIETNNVEVEVLSMTNSDNLKFKATPDVSMTGGTTITFTCSVVSKGISESITISRRVLAGYRPTFTYSISRYGGGNPTNPLYYAYQQNPSILASTIMGYIMMRGNVKREDLFVLASANGQGSAGTAVFIPTMQEDMLYPRDFIIKAHEEMRYARSRFLSEGFILNFGYSGL